MLCDTKASNTTDRVNSLEDAVRAFLTATQAPGAWWYAPDMMKQGRTVMSARTALLVWLGGALIYGAPTQVANQVKAKSAAIAVTLRANETTLKTGDALVVEQTITNRSDHEVTIGREVYHPGCAVDVLDASGNFAADKKVGYRHGRLDAGQLARMSSEEMEKSGLLRGKLALIKLKPRESFSVKCDVNDFYDLTRPGQYRITADYPDPESTARIRTNTIEVTVGK